MTRTLMGGGAQSPFRFAGTHGYVTDEDTGMQLLGARFYLPTLGRFLTQDPIGQEGGLNLYAYADNNPLTRVDPDGLDGVSIGGFQFDGESIGTGLTVSMHALGSSLSFGLYDGGDYKGYAGFGESRAAWTVAQVVAPVVAPEAASGLGIRALEAGVGHVAERHLLKTAGYLSARIAASRGMRQASSFYSATIANIIIRRTIGANEAKIAAWLAGGALRNLELDYTGRMIVGYGVRRGASQTIALKGARTVLQSNGRGGFHVLTAFPR